jgi:valyl-tRNA synthetase
MISIFDERARTNKEAGSFAGLDRFEARKRVLEALTEQGLLVDTKPHKLSAGLCQRSGTLVEPRLSPQWFVRIQPLAKPAIEAVESGKTRFVPEAWTQTFFTWMRNIHDWCISRQLWWGHQIPAYYCTTCSPRVGDDTDLPLESATTKVGGVDFARAEPIVSREAPAKCPKCGGSRFEQDQDVLDTWFSSGLWPFSTLGWPEKTIELEQYYPNTVMETAPDIIFFWVARMMMMGLHFMKDVPFRTVYLHAIVRDEKGEKMSKVKGNVIDPLDLILGQKAEALPGSLRNKFPQGMPAFGADALRFTLAALTQQGRDIKLSLDRVAGYRAFSNKLWNAARFAMMNLDGYVPDSRHIKDRPLTLADRWILARLDRTVVETVQALEGYQFAEAAGTLYQFIWRELCDWYIELSKISLTGADAQARHSAQAVLVFCLDRVLRLLHPFMPFITEEIWQKLPLGERAESIMISPYPQRDRKLEDAPAEVEMAPVVAAIEGLRNIRGESNLPPATRIEAQIQTPIADLRRTLEKWQGYVIPLAGLARMHVGPPATKPAQAASFVGDRMEIFVPLAGIIDLGEEQSRLGKEISRVEKDLAGLERKLGNPDFVAKAPPDVVKNDRARVDELKAKRAKLQDNLKRIAPEGHMSQESKPPNGNGAPPLPSILTPEAAEVRIAEAADGGQVDLARELRPELEGMKVPDNMDPQVRSALDKLRQGTKEGLSPSDHYNLGVAYMGMGLVDDAVAEFNAAKKPAKKKAAARKPKKKPTKKVAKSKPKTKAKKKKPTKRPGRRG